MYKTITLSLTTYSINNKDWNSKTDSPVLVADNLTTYSINNKDWNHEKSGVSLLIPCLTTYSINNKDWNSVHSTFPLSQIRLTIILP